MSLQTSLTLLTGTKSKSLVRHSGAVEILIDVVKSDKKPRSVLSVALRTLSYLITTVKDQNKIRESALFPYLVNIAESSPSDKIRQNAIKLIFKAIFDNGTHQNFEISCDSRLTCRSSHVTIRNEKCRRLEIGAKYLEQSCTRHVLPITGMPRHFWIQLQQWYVPHVLYFDNIFVVLIVLVAATIQKQIVEMGILDKLIEIVRSSPSVMLLYRSIDAIHASCFNNSTSIIECISKLGKSHANFFTSDTNKELVLHSGGIEQIIALLDENESTNVPNVLLSCVLSCLSALADGNRKWFMMFSSLDINLEMLSWDPKVHLREECAALARFAASKRWREFVRTRDTMPHGLAQEQRYGPRC